MRAWDLPTRIFHWLLAALIAGAWLSFQYAEAMGDYSLKMHRYNGYALLILIVWRVIWGFIGPETVRFSRWVRGPAAAISFSRGFLAGREPKYLSHNPVAGYVMLAILMLIGTQAVLGLMSEEHNATTWGPLFFLVPPAVRTAITEWHIWLYYNTLLVLVAVHILSAFAHDGWKRDGITKAMVTGRKLADDYVDGGGIEQSPTATLIRALIALAVAIAIMFGGIVALGGKLFY